MITAARAIFVAAGVFLSGLFALTLFAQPADPSLPDQSDGELDPHIDLNGIWSSGPTRVDLLHSPGQVLGVFHEIGPNDLQIQSGETLFELSIRGGELDGTITLRAKREDESIASINTPVSLILDDEGNTLSGVFENRRFDRRENRWLDDIREQSISLVREPTGALRFVLKNEFLGVDLDGSTGTYRPVSTVRPGVPFWIELEVTEPEANPPSTIVLETPSGDKLSLPITPVADSPGLHRTERAILLSTPDETVLPTTRIANSKAAQEAENRSFVPAPPPAGADLEALGELPAEVAAVLGNYRIEYFDRNLTEVIGTGRVLLDSNNRIRVLASLRDPDTGRVFELNEGSTARLSGTRLTATLSGDTPTHSRVITGHSAGRLVANVTNLTLTAEPGAELRAIHQGQSTTATLGERPAPELPSIRLTLEHQPDGTLNGEFEVEFDEEAGFIGNRRGRLEAEEGRMVGTETWTPFDATVTSVETLDLEDFSTLRYSSLATVGGDVATFWIRINGTNLPSPDDNPSVHFSDPAIRLSSEKPRFRTPAEATEGNALDVRVTLSRLTRPGEKTVVLDDLPALWQFDFPGLEPSEVRLVRPIFVDRADPAELIFLGEMFYAEIEFPYIPFYKEREGELRTSSGKQPIRFEPTDENPRVFRSPAFLLPPPNPDDADPEILADLQSRPSVAIPIPANARRIAATPGTNLNAALTDTPWKQIPAGTALVGFLPGNDWTLALEAARDCWENSSHSGKRNNPEGYSISNRILFPLSGNITNPRWTGSNVNRIDVTLRDHAALMLLREEAARAVDENLARQKTAIHARSIHPDRTFVEDFALVQRLRAAANAGASHPLFYFYVDDGSGSGRGIPLSSALDGGHLNQLFGGDTARRNAYLLQVLREAQDDMAFETAVSGSKLDNTSPCDIEQLLKLVGHGFDPIIRRIQAKMVVPDADGSGRMVADRAGYASIDKIRILHEAVSSQRELASLDKQFAITAASAAAMILTGGATGVATLAQGTSVANAANLAANAARWGVIATDLADIGFGASEIYESATGLQEDVDYRRGLIDLLGTEQYEQALAEQQAKFISGALSVGLGAAGNLAPTAIEQIAKRLRSDPALAALVRRAETSGIDSLSPSQRAQVQGLYDEARQSTPTTAAATPSTPPAAATPTPTPTTPPTATATTPGTPPAAAATPAPTTPPPTAARPTPTIPPAATTSSGTPPPSATTPSPTPATPPVAATPTPTTPPPAATTPPAPRPTPAPTTPPATTTPTPQPTTPHVATTPTPQPTPPPAATTPPAPRPAPAPTTPPAATTPTPQPTPPPAATPPAATPPASQPSFPPRGGSELGDTSVAVNPTPTPRPQVASPTTDKLNQIRATADDQFQRARDALLRESANLPPDDPVLIAVRESLDNARRRVDAHATLSDAVNDARRYGIPDDQILAQIERSVPDGLIPGHEGIRDAANSLRRRIVTEENARLADLFETRHAPNPSLPPSQQRLERIQAETALRTQEARALAQRGLSSGAIPPATPAVNRAIATELAAASLSDLVEQARRLGIPEANIDAILARSLGNGFQASSIARAVAEIEPQILIASGHRIITDQGAQSLRDLANRVLKGEASLADAATLRNWMENQRAQNADFFSTAPRSGTYQPGVGFTSALDGIQLDALRRFAADPQSILQPRLGARPAASSTASSANRTPPPALGDSPAARQIYDEFQQLSPDLRNHFGPELAFVESKLASLPPADQLRIRQTLDIIERLNQSGFPPPEGLFGALRHTTVSVGAANRGSPAELAAQFYAARNIDLPADALARAAASSPQDAASSIASARRSLQQSSSPLNPPDAIRTFQDADTVVILDESQIRQAYQDAPTQLISEESQITQSLRNQVNNQLNVASNPGISVEETRRLQRQSLGGPTAQAPPPAPSTLRDQAATPQMRPGLGPDDTLPPAAWYDASTGQTHALQERIGSGAFSDVYAVTPLPDGREVVVKVPKEQLRQGHFSKVQDLPKRQQQIAHQAESSQLLRDRNIPQLQVVDQHIGDHPYLVVERASASTDTLLQLDPQTRRYVDAAGNPIGREQQEAVLELFRDLADKRVAAFDLHGENIVFRRDPTTGRTSALILDHDYIGDFDTFIAHNLDELGLSPVSRDIHAKLQRYHEGTLASADRGGVRSLSQITFDFNGDPHYFAAKILEHKGWIRYENGRFVSGQMDIQVLVEKLADPAFAGFRTAFPPHTLPGAN